MSEKGIIIVIIVVVLALVGCGIFTATRNGFNYQMIDTNWNFTWAIIQLGNGELLEGEVTSWRDFSDSDMIQVTLDNSITFMTHSSNVILCTECP